MGRTDYALTISIGHPYDGANVALWHGNGEQGVDLNVDEFREWLVEPAIGNDYDGPLLDGGIRRACP